MVKLQDGEPSRLSRLRGVITGVLTVLAALAVLVATVAVWIHSTALDTDRFVETVRPALTDDAVTDALAGEVTDLVFQLVDVEARISAGLGIVDAVVSGRLDAMIDDGSLVDRVRDTLEVPTLASFGPLLADELSDRIEARVTERLRSEQVRDVMIGVVTATHRTAVAVIRHDTAHLPDSVSADEALQLDLVPVVVGVLGEVAEELVGIVDLGPLVANANADPHATVRRIARLTDATIPDDYGIVTVVSAERLADVRDGAARFDRLVIWLVILAAVLVVVTVATARRRWRTAGWLAVSVLVALGLSRLVINRLREVVIDMIDPEAHAAAEAVLAATVHSMQRIGIVVVVGAVVALTGAVLVGWMTPKPASR